MRPYYADASCVIYHVDCRDVLSEVTADVVVTDPPYGVGELTGTQAKKRGKNRYASAFDDSEDYVRLVDAEAAER